MSEPTWEPDPATGIAIRRVEANGLHFEVAAAGSGGHLALCLHGFPECNYAWREQIPVLVRLGYRVWAPNLRGYGRSSRPLGVAAYDLPLLLDDLAGLIDAAGADDVTLLAHDWGGALAWSFAMQGRRPLARLVVMNAPHPRVFARELKTWAQRRRSWYMYFFQLPGLPELLLAAQGARRIRRAFRDASCRPERFPDEVLEVYARQALQPGALTAMLNWYRAAMRRHLRGGGDGGAPAPLEVPTLVIWGEQDQALGLGNLDGLERHVRRLTLERLPGVSHWVQQEAPDEVNALLEAWLPDYA